METYRVGSFRSGTIYDNMLTMLMWLDGRKCFLRIEGKLEIPNLE